MLCLSYPPQKSIGTKLFNRWSKNIPLIFLKVLNYSQLPQHFSLLVLQCQMPTYGTYLVVQWLRIWLLVQGTWVQTLVQGDPTHLGGTNPMHHNYGASTPEPLSCNCWVRMLQLLKPACLEPVLRNKRSNHEKPPITATRESLSTATDPAQSKIN